MEDKKDKLVIQLLIGKQVFPITIRRDQEEIYRKASKMIPTNWDATSSRTLT